MSNDDRHFYFTARDTPPPEKHVIEDRDDALGQTLAGLLARRPRVHPPADFARRVAGRAAAATTGHAGLRLAPLRWGPSLLLAGLICLVALMLWCASAPQGTAVLMTESVLCVEFPAAGGGAFVAAAICRVAEPVCAGQAAGIGPLLSLPGAFESARHSIFGW